MLRPGTPGCTTRADFSTPAGVLRKGVITISPEFTRPTRQILMTSLSGCPLTHSMPITRCLVFSLVKYYDYETVKPNSFPESSGKLDECMVSTLSIVLNYVIWQSFERPPRSFEISISFEFYRHFRKLTTTERTKCRR